MRKKKDGWHTFDSGEALIAFLTKNKEKFYKTNVGYFILGHCCNTLIYGANGAAYKLGITMANEFANGLKFKENTTIIWTATRSSYWINPEVVFNLSDYFVTSGAILEYEFRSIRGNNGV